MLECFSMFISIKTELYSSISFQLTRPHTKIADTKNSRIKIAHFAPCEKRKYHLASLQLVLKFWKTKPIEAHMHVMLIHFLGIGVRTHRDSTGKFSKIILVPSAIDTFFIRLFTSYPSFVLIVGK